jgi:hypothetical protein
MCGRLEAACGKDFEIFMCSLWIYLSSYWIHWICQNPGKDWSGSHALIILLVVKE